MMRRAEGHYAADDHTHDSTDKHPDGFIGGISGEKAGEVGADGIRSIDAENYQRDAGREQRDSYCLVHMSVFLLWFCPQPGAGRERFSFNGFMPSLRFAGNVPNEKL